MTAAITLGLLLCFSSSGKAQRITVELSSGRTFTAAVDERTDDQQLWLRFQGAGTTLLRPVDWTAVEAAWIGEEPVIPTQLQSQAAQLASPAPEYSEPTAEQIPAGSPTFAQQARVALAPAAPTRSIDFEAGLANWDGDVEMDGLELHLYPLDAYGRLSTVSGTVEVELIAARSRAFSERPHGQGRAIEQIGRWTYVVSPEDYGPGGAVLHLPFQAIHPEFDTDTYAHGLVHVRFVAPGQGTFEASHDPVRIRPFSPLRDNHQRVEHERFFAGERTGRGQRHTD